MYLLSTVIAGSCLMMFLKGGAGARKVLVRIEKTSALLFAVNIMREKHVYQESHFHVFYSPCLLTF